MEVDEISKEIKENLKTQIKEETLNFCYEVEKSNDYSTVIKDNQNMKEPEYNLIHNSVNYVNCNDKKDVKEEQNDSEMLENGDLLNCVDESVDLNSKKLLNTVNEKDNIKLLDSLIKSEEACSPNEINGADCVKVCKFDDTEHFNNNNNNNNNNDDDDDDDDGGGGGGVGGDDAKIDEEKKNSELKSTDENIEKCNVKTKDLTSSSNITCIPNASSCSASYARKVDDQNESHHSSSSKSSTFKYKEHKDCHQSSSSSKSSRERSSSHKLSDQEKSKHESSGKKKRSCHHKSNENCNCKSHHHSRHHSKRSKKFQSVKTQCSADEIAYELRGSKTEIPNPYFTRVPWIPHPQLVNLKYGRYYRIEIDRNGGASTVHLYMDEISHLNETQMKECANEFIKLSYSEDENECAYHVMGVVHGAAAYLPDLVDYMADHYPTLIVKTGSLASRDNHTTTMSQYRDEVYKTYSNGTFRYAPLDQLSICGVLGEEVGAYFPDFVARLEQSPFMKPVMPWSSLSVVETDNPRESNDGPIFWVRPGEQMLPANEALKESARPKKRRNNELDNLAYIAGSRSSEARESLFMDRTKAHADQVGVDYGISNTAPTAAVGVLKSVNCGHPEHGNRATKDVVAFHAQDYNELLEILMLDLYEPPQTQCTKWIEVSKLNTLRREGIRYAHVQLHDSDVYYLPRKIIHQFQTISSVASVAWHIRYKDYFSIMGAPNLHTPTGINKGQVFYEKKKVSIYYPPVCENDLLASVSNPSSPLSKTPKKCEKIKDYSPFKHSPRKHKVYSPRSNTKKEKGSDSLTEVPYKKVSETNADEKKSNSSHKKQEYSKSDVVKENSNSEGGSKKECEVSIKKMDKSEYSNHHHQSNSSKKERRENQDARSSHRKEVKNLNADFDLKKSKSKSMKSPSKTKNEKSGRDDKRRNDEMKSDSSRRHKKHKDSRTKSHNKHEKHSSQKKMKPTCSTPSSTSAENSRKSEEKNHESASLKRKNGDDLDSCLPKKIKNENSDLTIVENGEVRESCSVTDENKSNEFESHSTNSKYNNYDSVLGKENNSDISKCNNNLTLDSNKSPDSRNCDSSIRISAANESEAYENNLTVNVVNNEELKSEARCVKNVTETCDLMSRTVENIHTAAPRLSPPLPSTSPPSNPPLPPASPVSETSSCSATSDIKNCKEESKLLQITSSNAGINNPGIEESAISNETIRDQEHSSTSKDKSNELFQRKKLKKKLVKKCVKGETESYDLLGDIMSLMDKKK